MYSDKEIRPNYYTCPKVVQCLLKIPPKGVITLNSGLSARFILTSHVFFLLV